MDNAQPTPLAFQGKYVLQGTIYLKTGLHIGGTQAEYEIGGEENLVVKDPITGEPYIPGSSLKGKMRSLLEWAYQAEWQLIRVKSARGGYEGEVRDEVNGQISDLSIVFGPYDVRKKEKFPKTGPTRVIFRDAFLTERSRQRLERTIGPGQYTETKTENAIDRVISRANPRTMERVPAGTGFTFEILFDIYETADHDRLQYILQGLRLLEDSALGGGGSRGSGRIQFQDIRVEWRGRAYYTDGTPPVILIEKADTTTLWQQWREWSQKVRTP